MHAQPVAGMQRRDRQAGARPDVDQTFPGQPLDRLAHRRAAEPETLDQRAFGGDAARRQFQRHDHALQRPIGPRAAGSLAMSAAMVIKRSPSDIFLIYHIEIRIDSSRLDRDISLIYQMESAMWTGVFPAVTTKFTEDDGLDHAEMERCFALQMEAGCDGIIVCGSLGEGPMLSHRREARGAEDRAEGRRRASRCC